MNDCRFFGTRFKKEFALKVSCPWYLVEGSLIWGAGEACISFECSITTGLLTLVAWQIDSDLTMV